MLGIVVANMVRAIRTISVERGYDPREYTLMAFGGAGPLHARDVALALGMREILVPAAPGILCAEGLIVSDLKEDFVVSERLPGDAAGLRRLAAHTEALTARAVAWFDSEGVPAPSRRLLEVVDHYSASVIRTAFDEIVARTERRLRAAIAEVPDGRYTFEDVMDGDGVETVDVPIRLEVVIAGDRAHFDFAGTSPQVKGNVNVTMNATRASVCYALKAMLDLDVPNNEGVLAVAEIDAEPGTMLNAGFPAPVASRAHTCQRIIDVVLGAFREALPDRVIGAANGANTTAVFAGTDPRSGNGYLYLETLGGGMGGRVTKDGKDVCRSASPIPRTCRWRRSSRSIPFGSRSTAWSRTRAGPAATAAAWGCAAWSVRSITTAFSTASANASATGRGACSAASPAHRGGSCCATPAETGRGSPTSAGSIGSRAPRRW